MPGVGYIAVRMSSLAGRAADTGQRLVPTSPWTSAMSSVPASSIGTFSVLPLVLIASILKVGSAASTAAMKAAP